MTTVALQPCTWEMSAVQLISPTTSPLAVINAIQTAVAASSSWLVNATGTTTAGYKWLEIKPSNTTGHFKDARILFVERIVAVKSNFGTYNNTTFLANSTSNFYFTYCPVGGAAGVTFTPANIEATAAGQQVYVGAEAQKYNYFNNPGYYDNWGWMPTPATAIWLYLCDGQFWMINRAAATSHYVLGMGGIYASGNDTYIPLRPDGTRWQGSPGIFLRTTGLSNVTTTNTVWNTAASKGRWWLSAGNASLWKQDTTTAPQAQMSPTSNAFFFPLSANDVQRGVYQSYGYKTRTTLQDGGVTVGYTFYPDDAGGAGAWGIAFLNG